MIAWFVGLPVGVVLVLVFVAMVVTRSGPVREKPLTPLRPSIILTVTRAPEKSGRRPGESHLAFSARVLATARQAFPESARHVEEVRHGRRRAAVASRA